MSIANPARIGGQRSVGVDPVRPALSVPTVDVVVPVHNEEIDLAGCVRRLHRTLSESLPYSFRITVADNASSDATLRIANELSAEFSDVAVVHLDRKGRGRALNQVWSASPAEVLAYMDVDLSTDLAAVLPLVAPLISGHSDLAIGTRLHPGAQVTRGAKRELISRSYNLLLRRTLAVGFSDAQCGFKAIRRDVAARLLPHVEDTGWFFDTELLVLAERAGARIHEVPVDWVDDPDSRVDILATAWADLKGIVRVRRALAGGRLRDVQLEHRLGRRPTARHGHSPRMTRFLTIGVASTLAYLGVFWALTGRLGGQGANAAALLLTAVANTAANRRFTFGVRGRTARARQQVQGLGVFAVGLGMTSGALALLHAVDAHPGRPAELAVLVAANLAATAARFVLLRGWVFRPEVRGTR
jgi:putative flippase GtrA